MRNPTPFNGIFLPLKLHQQSKLYGCGIEVTNSSTFFTPQFFHCRLSGYVCGIKECVEYTTWQAQEATENNNNTYSGGDTSRLRDHFPIIATRSLCNMCSNWNERG